AEQFGDFLPRLIEVSARVSPEGMDRVGVPQLAGNAKELFACFGAERGRCRMVEVRVGHPHSVVLPAAVWVCRRPQLRETPASRQRGGSIGRNIVTRRSERSAPRTISTKDERSPTPW